MTEQRKALGKKFRSLLLSLLPLSCMVVPKREIVNTLYPTTTRERQPNGLKQLQYGHGH